MSHTEAEYSDLDDADIGAFRARQKWLMQARSPRRQGKQIPPTDGDWDITLFLAGRGFGKTSAITEWGWWEAWRAPSTIGHVLAPTYSDARGTVFEGPAGFRSIIPAECLWRASWDRAYTSTPPIELKLSNGSIIRGFGAVEEASRLRGPQCHWLIGDELREWDKPAGNLELALNNALFGLRLIYPDGTPARALLATTSKPIPYLKRLQRREGVRVVRGTSYENLQNLSSTFRRTLFALEGTNLGRQEIHGAMLDEESDTSIIKRSWIKLWPARKPLPSFHFIVESYDTAASEENFDKKRQETDPTASIVLGIFNVADAFTEAERKKLGTKNKYAALLCEAWSERLGLPELLEKARKQHRVRWGGGGRGGDAMKGRQADIVLIEDKSSGPGLRQFLAKYGVPAWPTNPGRLDKTMRLHGVSPLIAQGMLFVPESLRPDREGMPRDWVEPYLEQICAFSGPGSVEHDDFVDCLLPATGIYTKRGLIPIREVKLGDFVLTHAGRWRRVSFVGSRISDHHYRLKAKGLDEIGITGNHRVLVMSVAAPQRKGKEARGAEWKRVENLVPRPTFSFQRRGKTVQCVRRVIHDAMVVPRAGTAGTDIDLASRWAPGELRLSWEDAAPITGTSLRTRRHVVLDGEAGWAFGLFAAEGCVSGHQIIWACDEEAIKRIASWASSTFGRRGHTESKTRTPHIWAFSLGCSVAMPLFREFGRHAANKTVPAWCLNAPLSFVRGFVDGYAHGDGSRFKGRRVSLTSTSPSLLFGIRLMLAKIGISSWNGAGKEAGPRNVFGKTSDCQAAHRLDYTDDQKSWFATVTPDHLATHIEVCKRVEGNVEVFNLEVEEDESYLTVGGIVHNCTSGAFGYLRDRNILEAEPNEKVIDREEWRDAEEQKALDLAERQKRKKGGNPYG